VIYRCPLAFLVAAVLVVRCAVGQEHPDIPSAAAFDSVLNHDLRAYFGPADASPVTISHELLRRGPTITGIAYPKYYLWLEVRSRGQLVRVGAARVAAIDKRFQITQFIPAQYITEHPDSVRGVFPAALVEGILMRARNAPAVPKRGA
jgi:hypothetical protein